MKLHTFKNNKEYVKAQISAYNRKKDNVWVTTDELDFLIKDLTKHVSFNIKGICHGVRTGFEVDYLIGKLHTPNIFGTDIAKTDHHKIFQHDFHNDKPAWHNLFDFVYSNSLDHAHDPQLAINTWLKTLKPSGIIYLSWSATYHNSYRVTPSDCFQADLQEYIDLVGANYNHKSHIMKNGHVIISFNMKLYV